ncbi:hypothetical protein SY27_11320 [Flavobacterium sp. 316]|uniref:GNAT family N-acetyltransferase n=1 Tax=Flavobacterium sp. 316 TaxID=1603293 RepID=UPI0005E61AA0|nr:GNAT family N-acetyltransferase [Flavobacterium sp. 316]KIX20500.1 hypothetical protein SY27_11320 [Flavobacterium sp. 316]
MIKRLEWDSNFFEMEIGELFYKQQLNIEDVIKYHLLYVKGNEDFEAIIPNFTNSFSEIKVVFAKKLKTKGYMFNNIFSCDELTYNIKDLYKLAFESGKNSRFNLDKKFSRKKFEELYTKWIDNSINKKFADDVFIYQENKVSLGFVTFKVYANFATIGLIAVDPSSQGKGIGSKLIDAVEEKVIDLGINILQIPTQLENKSACSFYKKKEYSIEKITFIKHFWKN